MLTISGRVMVLNPPHWTNIGVSFVLLNVNQFRHPTRIEHGLYLTSKEGANTSKTYVLESNIDL